MTIVKILVGVSLLLGLVQILKDWKVWKCEIKNGLEEAPLKTILIVAVVIIVLILIIRWIL